MAHNIGKISQVIGPVVDITFDQEDNVLPGIYDALEIVLEGQDNLVLECQQHIGENTVRAIAMDSTDGFRRGMEVIATGKTIMMPKGENVLGRLLNVTGNPVDGLAPLKKTIGSLPFKVESACRARRRRREWLAGTSRKPVPPGFRPRLDDIPLSASKQSAGTHLSAMTQKSLHGGKPVYSTSISKL